MNLALCRLWRSKGAGACCLAALKISPSRGRLQHANYRAQKTIRIVSYQAKPGRAAIVRLVRLTGCAEAMHACLLGRT